MYISNRFRFLTEDLRFGRDVYNEADMELMTKVKVEWRFHMEKRSPKIIRILPLMNLEIMILLKSFRTVFLGEVV
ncbi:hypothetical protein PIB30_013545 [Stylosanthes scabra]|uniref:Uncharacterized protein n=1 Tax=Stylosanthes scabra TaxID=79078 RepID=A0ABU6R6L9_9FABA|nr:hypothetical protein [Stylosanthes scabra]